MLQGLSTWLLLLLLLLGHPDWYSPAAAALTERQAQQLTRPCQPFTAASARPTVMVLGDLPLFAGPLLRQLRHRLTGTLKLLLKGQPAEAAPLCAGAECEVDLEADVCPHHYSTLPFDDLQQLLDGTELVLLFAPRAPAVTDIMAQEKLIQAAAGIASAYLYVAPAASHQGASLEQALVDQVLHHARQPRGKLRLRVARLFDVYGPDFDAGDAPSSIVPHLIRQAIEKDAFTAPPEAKPLYDFVHVADAAAALQVAAALPPLLFSDVEVATGQVTSLAEAMHIVQHLAATCLARSVQVPVVGSIRAQQLTVAFNVSHPWLSHWKPHITPRQGFAIVMRQMLAALGNRSAAPAGVDVEKAAACLHAEAHQKEHIVPHFTLAAQLGHPIVCTPTGEPTPGTEEKKTLVVSIGLVRAYRITWHTFEREVLNPEHLGGPVDLAIATPSGFDTEAEKETNHFFQRAKYVWEVNNPPGNNYRHYFNEISQACFNRTFSPHDAANIGARFPGNFMGLITEANHEWGGAALIFFKWLALQQLLFLKLLPQYRYIVITRSDFVWTGPHPSLEPLKPKHVLIPTGSDWEGINDRHMAMTAADAPSTLSLCERLIDRPSQQVIDSLLAEGFRPGTYGNYNSESYLRWWLASHCIEAQRFPSRAYIVWDRQQPGSTGKFHVPFVPRPTKLMVIPKYPDEYDEAMRNAA